jgi:hypothetical protein
LFLKRCQTFPEQYQMFRAWSPRSASGELEATLLIDLGDFTVQHNGQRTLRSSISGQEEAEVIRPVA